MNILFTIESIKGVGNTLKKETIKILQELCKDMNINIESLSYDWIYKLSKASRVIYITGNFDINKTASSKIASDKYATYEVLKSDNIPVIKHTMLFNPIKRKEYIKEDIFSIVKNEFKKEGKIVVKPNYGFEGKGVFLCNTICEAEEVVKYLLEKNTSISICPFYDIKKEYRAFYLNGKILLIYEKEKPHIIGNGNDNVRTLVERLKLPDNEVVKNNLSKIDMDYVPKLDEKIELSWKHNLYGGATAKVINKEYENYTKIEELAIKAGKALDMTFASIDIIKTKKDQIYVLEINSGVATSIFSEIIENGKELTKEIYKSALIEIFK